MLKISSGGNGILITEVMVTEQIGRSMADNEAAGTDGLGSLFVH